MSPKETKKQRQFENFVMARQSPWMLWRALAYQQGYVPPLIVGEIPDDIPLRLAAQRPSLEAPRLLHAGSTGPLQMQNVKTQSVSRHVVAFLLGLSIALASIGFVKAVSSGKSFRIPAVHSYVGSK